jgi:MoaA/NifB/PqqE/SkfB family radical SAM enzyme
VTYIDPRAKVLRHIDRLAAWSRGQTPAPVTVEWDLSNRCSLGCQDCHFAHTHTLGPWATKLRTLPMAFDQGGDLADIGLVERALGELTNAGVKGIVWSGGGEPTLHPEWQRAVACASAHGLQQGMYTLGGHLVPGSAALLAEHAAFVVISLDAADAETYAREKNVAPTRFEAACSGVVRLSGGKAAIGVSFLLHAGNYQRVNDMLALTRQLGATYATLRPAIRFSADRPGVPSDDRSWITDAVPLLRHVAEEPDVELDVTRFLAYRDWQGHGYSACQGIRLNATITPDGRVWVCPNRRGMPGSCLGDLRAESFGAIWARHPASFAVNEGCRVMCRLHSVNETLAALSTPRLHEAFV